ncbi:LOW QUALITY PROTEIN: putative receptor-like protein kinase At5g39000 [Juglans microcarpa x Juglans regia]|uniref:LOW QUALITY PROTEIN: putative receptor-like protein kinase At5g39000 n=1 Tax=Juglans microcarpa x Juglans regia TaxID=2249226 RepID=UPI001B7DCE59|nr:LOW QUALITY PROTEIN: putative receptor-like protein kinase At5g39000 [Juglans microcarpa x Juglans regia]
MAIVALLCLFSTIVHLLPSLPITTAKTPPPYTPTDYFLLNCGSSSNSTSLDGRRWEGDSNSMFSPTTFSTSSSSNASKFDPSLSQVPYMTARIFDRHSKFTYSFPVSPGPKFLRLYFYPTSYSNHDKTKSFFSVTANDFTLLSNFSAYLSISTTTTSTTFIVKEFIVHVQQNQNLDVTFKPSPSSYAFINGIEVVSMPSKLYNISNQETSPVTFVNEGDNSPFYINNLFAFETLYRLNVGGKDISNVDDTGMFRSWSQDEDYIFGKAFGTMPHRSNVTIKYTEDTPPYTAPEIIYTSSRTMGTDPNINLKYNLTWIFSVDVGFLYLVRLHFCETQLEVTHENQRVFRVFIYNQTAEEQMDVIQWSGGNGSPVYRDYVVLVPGKSQAKQVLWLALHPNRDVIPKPDYADAILNGVEIFKLNQSDGNLAGPNPEPTMVGPSPTSSEQEKKTTPKNNLSPIMIATGIATGALLAILINICFLAHYQRRRKRSDESGMSLAKSSWVPFSRTWRSTDENVSTLPLELCRYFSIVEIKAATNNFDRQLVIGAGGFGNVYKGYIDSGSTAVAIKRLNPSSKQGTREFWTEIHMLSQLRHVNLVALIGYCDDQDEMILVYEYVARGTLRSHLYGNDNPTLTWKQRVQICIGAAHGLNYLHTGAKNMIIHRDVKSTNILLDERLLAKVSDFGLSKLGPTSMSQTHVSTVVKGSFGYVDPEYYRRQKLTEKSDVYSFGVVMFEVLCARPALMPSQPKEQVNLAQWARKCYHNGTLDQIADPCLRGEIAYDCLNKFGEVADSCIRDRGIERPTMRDVVWALQFVLKLQENAEKNIGHGVEDVGCVGLDTGGTQASPSNPRGEVTASDFDDLFSSPGHVLNSRSSWEASSGGKSIQMGWNNSISNSKDG